MKKIIHTTHQEFYNLTCNTCRDDEQDSPDDIEVIMGGITNPPLWDEYLDAVIAPHRRPHILAIRQAIEQIPLMHEKADAICNDTWFEFSDGVKIGFTWRAWGDLMQAIVNKREGYMAYYM